MSKLEEREAKRKSFVQKMTENNDEDTEGRERTNGKPVEKLVQRSYYLSEELLKAITIKTADGELDKSGVVREALKLYLADVIAKF